MNVIPSPSDIRKIPTLIGVIAMANKLIKLNKRYGVRKLQDIFLYSFIAYLIFAVITTYITKSAIVYVIHLIVMIGLVVYFRVHKPIFTQSFQSRQEEKVEPNKKSY